MEPTPIIILKRPNTVKHDDQTVEKTTSQATSKTLEEKLAKYEEARRRILGSDSEEDQQDGSEKPASEPEIIEPVVTPKPKASPSPPTKGSPEKAAPKSNGITPLMSIEFKQMENAMENLALKPADEGGRLLKSLEGGRQKKSLFRVESAEAMAPQMLMANSGEPFVPPPPLGYHGHYVPPVMPNHFHVRQYVNNSILHPYANSSINHVRAHNHYPAQSYASHQQQPRFNLGGGAGGSFSAGQVNFVPNPPFSLNVPPPGYYPTPMQFPQSQQPMHNNHHQTFPEAAARQGKHQRHLDMNFS